jgi:hypothetical protein
MVKADNPQINGTLMNRKSIAYTAGLIALLLFTIEAKANAVQPDSIVVRVPAQRDGFRSVQIDAVTLLFINGISGSVDLDFTPLSRRTDLGIRGGVEHYSVTGIGGGDHNSPYLDYYFFLRTSTSGPNFQWDLYAGPAYHTSIGSNIFGSRTGVKFGTDFRYFLVPRTVGLILKLNLGAIGVGVTFRFGNGHQ